MESSETNNETHDQQPSTDGSQDHDSNPSPEHETHTTALVFLVIVAVVISFIALTGGEGMGPNGDNFGFWGDGDDDQTAMPSHINDATDPKTMIHGSIIPQEQIETTNATGISGLPENIFIEESSIESNQTTSGGQRIIIFTTDRSLQDLYGNYEAWMTDADYEIIQEVEDEYGAKIAARGPSGEQLTVSITRPDNDTPTRVMIDYVAAQ